MLPALEHSACLLLAVLPCKLEARQQAEESRQQKGSGGVTQLEMFPGAGTWLLATSDCCRVHRHPPEYFPARLSAPKLLPHQAVLFVVLDAPA